MNSENTIRKSVEVISVIALIVGASGCATQSGGGSKLGHNEVMQQARQDNNTIQVCDQHGAKMSCRTEDRDRVREQFEYLQQTTR